MNGIRGQSSVFKSALVRDSILRLKSDSCVWVVWMQRMLVFILFTPRALVSCGTLVSKENLRISYGHSYIVIQATDEGT